MQWPGYRQDQNSYPMIMGAQTGAEKLIAAGGVDVALGHGGLSPEQGMAWMRFSARSEARACRKLDAHAAGAPTASASPRWRSEPGGHVMAKAAMLPGLAARAA